MNPITVGRKFDAQVAILEHKSIICAGYSAVMHIHCAAEEITVNVSSNKMAVFEKNQIFFLIALNSHALRLSFFRRLCSAWWTRKPERNQKHARDL